MPRYAAKTFCSGKVVFQDVYDYTLEDVIFLLENRDFSEFSFPDGEPYSLIYSEAGEVLTEHKGTDKVIRGDTVRRMLYVLEHIEECIEKAHDWICTLDSDEKLAATLGKGFSKGISKIVYEVNGINFGDMNSVISYRNILLWSQSRSGHHPKYASDSFSIEFQEARTPCFTFNVKFDYRDMLPFEIELWWWG